jgi:peptide-methionine (S)-S-oxide reductase
MESAGDATGIELATLGGGCFWCLEAVYEGLRGVKKVVSGYAGGAVADPTYRQICTGTTGHAEVVQVTFDAAELSYHDLLDVFFTIHDPTTLNRQGGDVGTQYRSVIFTHSEAQRQTAGQMIRDATRDGRFRDPIVTEVVPYEKMYLAEDYHQEYYRNNRYQPYCQVVIDPKVAKFRKKYAARLQEVPAAGG